MTKRLLIIVTKKTKKKTKKFKRNSPKHFRKSIMTYRNSLLHGLFMENKSKKKQINKMYNLK